MGKFDGEVKMRTNIMVDDNLMAEALKLSGIKRRRCIVDKANPADPISHWLYRRYAELVGCFVSLDDWG